MNKSIERCETECKDVIYAEPPRDQESNSQAQRGYMFSSAFLRRSIVCREVAGPPTGSDAVACLSITSIGPLPPPTHAASVEDCRQGMRPNLAFIPRKGTRRGLPSRGNGGKAFS